jgi:hypothetical protein
MCVVVATSMQRLPWYGNEKWLQFSCRSVSLLDSIQFPTCYDVKLKRCFQNCIDNSRTFSYVLRSLELRGTSTKSTTTIYMNQSMSLLQRYSHHFDHDTPIRQTVPAVHPRSLHSKFNAVPVAIIALYDTPNKKGPVSPMIWRIR